MVKKMLSQLQNCFLRTGDFCFYISWGLTSTGVVQQPIWEIMCCDHMKITHRKGEFQKLINCRKTYKAKLRHSITVLVTLLLQGVSSRKKADSTARLLWKERIVTMFSAFYIVQNTSEDVIP